MARVHYLLEITGFLSRFWAMRFDKLVKGQFFFSSSSFCSLGCKISSIETPEA